MNDIDTPKDSILRNEDIMRAEEDGWQPDSPPLFKFTRALPIVITMVLAALWYHHTRFYGWYTVNPERYAEEITRRLLVGEISIYKTCRVDIIRMLIGVSEYKKHFQRMPQTVNDFKLYIPPKKDPIYYDSYHDESVQAIHDKIIGSLSATNEDPNPECDYYSLPMIYNPEGQMDEAMADPLFEGINTECSVSTVAYKKYRDKYETTLRSVKFKIRFYSALGLPVFLLIIAIGLLVTIRWKTKRFGWPSIIIILFFTSLMQLMGFLYREIQYRLHPMFFVSCYTAGTVQQREPDELSLSEKYRLLDKALSKGDLTPDVVDKARQMMEQYSANTIR